VLGRRAAARFFRGRGCGGTGVLVAASDDAGDAIGVFGEKDPTGDVSTSNNITIPNKTI